MDSRGLPHAPTRRDGRPRLCRQCTQKGRPLLGGCPCYCGASWTWSMVMVSRERVGGQDRTRTRKRPASSRQYVMMMRSCFDSRRAPASRISGPANRQIPLNPRACRESVFKYSGALPRCRLHMCCQSALARPVLSHVSNKPVSVPSPYWPLSKARPGQNACCHVWARDHVGKKEPEQSGDECMRMASFSLTWS